MRIILPAIIIVVCLAFLATLLFAPLNLYLDIYSKIRPQAILVDNTAISWEQFKEEVKLVSFDKHLKKRGEKVAKALDQAVERQILKQTIAKESGSYPSGTLYDELKQLRELVLQTGVSWRTGGYFIAMFKTRDATQSADILKEKARTEITSLKNRLDEGEDFQNLLTEANQNPTLKYLNFGTFTPGNYFKQLIRKNFLLKIKSFEDQFFTIPIPSVSDVLTLSWDDYYGPTGDQKVSGEFAFAVIKIEEANQPGTANYDDWLREQKQQAKIHSFVLIPFFFKWF